MSASIWVILTGAKYVSYWVRRKARRSQLDLATVRYHALGAYAKSVYLVSNYGTPRQVARQTQKIETNTQKIKDKHVQKLGQSRPARIQFFVVLNQQGDLTDLL